MCNEDRLLNRSGDTPGTGIESLSLGDEELLKVISSDSFLKQHRNQSSSLIPQPLILGEI